MLSLPQPQPGPQAKFLDSSDVDIVVYGGAAGGGKTFGLLLDAASNTHNPNYGAVIFRRTSKQVRNEGGLWDESTKLYPTVGAEPKSSLLTWVFPTGAKVTFAHLQHEENKLDWQGAQIPYIGFDELTHFTESQFFYLLSRNRSMSGVRPRVRATCNPAPGWVKRFLSPWLDKGIPEPERAKSGEVRYFVRKEGEIVWVPADYRDADGQEPKSVTFIRSTIYDNQKLLDVNPEYLSNLKSLPDVERKRLLDGDWDVFEGAFFDEWSEARHTLTPLYTRDELPPAKWKFFGGLDWGYGKPFCFLLCATDEEGTVHVIDEVYQTKLENDEQAIKVRECITRWGRRPQDVLIAADPSMWTPKKQGELYRSDIEDYQSAGLSCAQAENSRRPGWTQIRNFLHADRIKVWKGNCPNLLRLMPESKYADKGDLEDLDTDSEDHAQDALRYALMTRPAPAIDPAKLPAHWRQGMVDIETGEHRPAIVGRGSAISSRRISDDDFSK